MNRIDCSLDKLGQKLTNTLYYNSLKSLPLSTYGLLTSGFYGNIYIGTSQKNGPRLIKKLNKDAAKKIVHSSKKNFVIKKLWYPNLKGRAILYTLAIFFYLTLNRKFNLVYGRFLYG